MSSSRSLCDHVLGVGFGDRHADVWVSLGYACGVGCCRRQLILLLFALYSSTILSIKIDYG